MGKLKQIKKLNYITIVKTREQNIISFTKKRLCAKTLNWARTCFVQFIRAFLSMIDDVMTVSNLRVS